MLLDVTCWFHKVSCLSLRRSSLTGTPHCLPPFSTSYGQKSSIHAQLMYTCSCTRLSSMESRRWVRHTFEVMETCSLLAVMFMEIFDLSKYGSCSSVTSLTGPPVGTCSLTATYLHQVTRGLLPVPAAPPPCLTPSIPSSSVSSKASQPPQRGGLPVHGGSSRFHGESTCQTQQHHATKPGEFWDTQQSPD